MLHLHLFGDHLLQHDIGLQLVCFVGHGLLAAALLGILRLLDIQIALRLRLPGLRGSLGDDTFLVGLRLGDGGFSERVALLIAVSRSASAVAISASRLMRATSGRPMFEMYSFLSRTSLMVKEMTSRPILLMSSAQVARMRSPTISGSLTICSTVNWPMMPRRWPSITSRIRPSRCCGAFEELLGRGQNRGLIAAHLDLRHSFNGHRHALLGVEILLRSHVEAHQFEAQLAAVLHHGKDHRAVALDDPRAAKSIDNQCLVGPGLAIHPGQQAQNNDQRQYAESDNQNNFDSLIVFPALSPGRCVVDG